MIEPIVRFTEAEAGEGSRAYLATSNLADSPSLTSMTVRKPVHFSEKGANTPRKFNQVQQPTHT